MEIYVCIEAIRTCVVSIVKVSLFVFDKWKKKEIYLVCLLERLARWWLQHDSIWALVSSQGERREWGRRYLGGIFINIINFILHGWSWSLVQFNAEATVCLVIFNDEFQIKRLHFFKLAHIPQDQEHKKHPTLPSGFLRCTCIKPVYLTSKNCTSWIKTKTPIKCFSWLRPIWKVVWGK